MNFGMQAYCLTYLDITALHLQTKITTSSDSQRHMQVKTNGSLLKNLACASDGNLFVVVVVVTAFNLRSHHALRD